MYKGTFDRPYAPYYKPGRPLIKDAHVVYINLDGFARYYFDELLNRQMSKDVPTLAKIIKEGVFFSDLRNTFPSITNPVQNQILTGSTSLITKNVYRYYEKKGNLVIQQHRENVNQTLVESVLDAGLSVVSVRHFLTEKHLTYHNPTRLYVESDSDSLEVVQRGSEKLSDYYSRFSSLNKVFKGEPVKTKQGDVVVDKLPNFTLLYVDDLDGLGHNFVDNYGCKKSESEVGRLNNVMDTLLKIDYEIGRMIEETKAAGVYDKLTFFLTTDHGMSPYGLLHKDDKSDYGQSKIGELTSALSKIDAAYKLEMVLPNHSPKSDTNVVAVGANLNLQLTFLKGIDEETLKKIKLELLKESYIESIFTREELKNHAYDIKDTDMIITPKHRYFFNPDPNAIYTARGQHDSSLPTSNEIVGWIWGKGIKKNHEIKEVAYNYDFGQTMAAALGVEIPNANGIVLDVFEIDNKD